MSLLNTILEALNYLNSHTKDERERKEQEEAAAYHYVWVMRERDKEHALLLEKKKELAVLISAGKVDADAGQALFQEMDLKEKLLNSKVMKIEKTQYNAWILDGFEKEKVERQRIQEAHGEIARLEIEGNVDPVELQMMRDELLKKEEVMDKVVRHMPRFPVK